MKLLLDALWVACVAKVVAWTVFDKADELFVKVPVPGTKLVENSADRLRYV